MSEEHSDLKRYLQEISYLRSLPEDANVRDEERTREAGGPETPEERLETIESIFGQEGWRFPDHPTPSTPLPTFSRMFHRMSGL